MKSLTSFAAALALLFTAATASAASLVYVPENISLTIPAGDEKQVPIKVGVETPNPSTYYLFYIDKIVNGNLPLSWLTVSPPSSFLFGGASGFSSLAIRVPAGTPSGIYSGSLLSRAMASHDIALAANGIRLDITVPSHCSGIPEVTITSMEPKTLWPPDHSLTQVMVSGTVVMPDGCLLGEAGYAVDDEYGVYSGVHSMQVQANGNFTALLPLEAMRHGRDKDGRHYTVTFYAKNQAGSGTSPNQVVVVPHDRSINRSGPEDSLKQIDVAPRDRSRKK